MWWPQEEKNTELWIKTVFLVLRLKNTLDLTKHPVAAAVEGKKNRGWNSPTKPLWLPVRAPDAKKWPQSAHLPKQEEDLDLEGKAALPRGVNLFLRQRRAQVAERPSRHQAGRRWSQKTREGWCRGWLRQWRKRADKLGQLLWNNRAIWIYKCSTIFMCMLSTQKMRFLFVICSFE